MTILQRFADPEIFKTMTFSEKMTASLYTTLLGMLITFTALLIIWGLINIMSNVIRSIESKGKQADVVSVPVVNKAAPDAEEDDEELIAVIVAAIAANMNTRASNIRVSNIARVNNSTPV